MRQLFFLFIAFIGCFSQNAQGQELKDGYVLLAKKDTIVCKIVFGGKKGTDKTQISILKKDGEEKTYLVKDKQILAYGFVQMGVSFDYLFMDFGQKVETGFFRLIENGDPYKLYVQNNSTTVKGITTITPHYVLFNGKGDFVNFSVTGISKWKKKLEAFFEDDPKSLEKLETVKKQDVADFLKGLNEI